MNKDIADLKEKLLTRKKEKEFTDLLSTGSTLLNIACTGDIRGGLRKGCYYLMVGDSSSGKTFLCLTMMAEACKNPKFDNYRLIYDDVENGALMDKEHFYGKKLAKRLEAPSYDKDKIPVYSSTVEELYFNLDDAYSEYLKTGRPYFYIVDSMDGLTTEDEEEQFAKEKKANQKGKEASGSYGTAKAKRNSSSLRVVCNQLRKSGSILIIISQTRDNIGFGSKFNPKTRSGGKALRFFATLEMWLACAGTIKNKVRDKDRIVGIVSQAKIKKNRITGKEPTVEFPISKEDGIDDLSSLINYLIEEKEWTGTEKTVKAPQFDFSGKKEDLIHKIEEENRELEIKKLALEVWRDIEEKCRVKRKRRYE